MKTHEILKLKSCHPELLDRAIAIEKAAAPNNRGAIKGLGRTWTWESLSDADDRQMEMFASAPGINCGCYDG